MGGTFFSIFLTTLPLFRREGSPQVSFPAGYSGEMPSIRRTSSSRRAAAVGEHVYVTFKESSAQLRTAPHRLSTPFRRSMGLRLIAKRLFSFRLNMPYLSAKFQPKIEWKNTPLFGWLRWLQWFLIGPIRPIRPIGHISPIALLPLPHCPPTKHPRSENYSGSRCGDIP